MAGNIRTFDPSELSVIVGVYPIPNFLKGDFLEVKRNVTNFDFDVGTEGEMARVAQTDKSGTITLKLQHESPANAVLSGLIAADEISAAGIFPINIADLSGNDVHTALKCFLMGYPEDGKYSTSPGRALTYIFICADLDMFFGGTDADSTFTSLP